MRKLQALSIEVGSCGFREFLRASPGEFKTPQESSDFWRR